MRRAVLPVMTLLALVLAGCSDGQDPPAGIPPAVEVSGVIHFERVPVGASGGLRYDSTTTAPAQRVRVQLWRGKSLAAEGVTDALGRYRFRAQGGHDGYALVAVAEMVEAGQVQARVLRAENETIGTTLAAGATFSTGREDQTVNMVIPSGWDPGAGAYQANNRVAGAFAILDTMRKAQDLVRQADPAAAFGDVQVLWNQAGTESAFYFALNRLVIAGAEGSDTDEFDEHVVAHEYGHFLMDRFARDDSFGGPHTIGDLLDETVAFSEGFATAFACLVVDDPVYKDSSGAGQATTTSFDIGAGGTAGTASTGTLDTTENDSDGTTDSIPQQGIYNELSVAGIIWDCHTAVGFAPVWRALVEDVGDTHAMTSLLPWLGGVRAGNETTIDAVAAVEAVAYKDDFIDSGFTIGPRYTELDVGDPALTLDAAERPLRTHEVFGSLAMDLDNGDPNPGLYNWQYFRTGTAVAGVYTIRVVPSSGNPVVSLDAWMEEDTVDVTDEGNTDLVLVDHPGGGPIVFRVGSTTGPATFSVRVTVGEGG